MSLCSCWKQSCLVIHKCDIPKIRERIELLIYSPYKTSNLDDNSAIT